MSLRFDAVHARVFVHLQGSISIEEIGNFFVKVPDVIEEWQAGSGRVNYDCIVDGGGAELSFKLPEMLLVAQYHADMPAFAVPGREVIVAPSDFLFGIARMYQSIQAGRKIEVVRTLEEAEEWLRTESISGHQ